MRPLDLNLASRPYRNNTLVWLAYIGLFLAAVAFSYWNVSSYRHYRVELGALDLEQGNLAEEKRDLTTRHRKILNGIKKFDRVAIARRTNKANEVIEWRAFSWTRLFNRLGKVLPSNIKMTSVRPVFRKADRDDEIDDPRRSMPVKGEGLARDWDALFELQSDLIENQWFGRVLPRHIDKLDNGELAFAIEFAYYPDETVAAADRVATEEVVQADRATPPPAEETKAADAGAGRPELPSATDKPAEVTDEWMAQGEKADAAVAAKAQPEPAKTARPTARRTLPKVQPEPASNDDEGDPR